MLFHKTQSDLALKYRKSVFQKNCAYLNRSSLQGFFFNTGKKCFNASNEKSILLKWELEIFKV